MQSLNPIWRRHSRTIRPWTRPWPSHGLAGEEQGFFFSRPCHHLFSSLIHPRNQQARYRIYIFFFGTACSPAATTQHYNTVCMNRDGSLGCKRHTHTRSFFDVPERSVACLFDRPGFFCPLSQFHAVARTSNCQSVCEYECVRGPRRFRCPRKFIRSLIMSCHCLR